MVVSEHRPFNVLVLGSTQAGKSSLIKKLQQLSVIEHGEEPAIGHGGISKTTEVTTYSLKIPFTEWQLVEKGSGTEIRVPRDEESLFKKKGLASRKDMTVEAINPEPEYVHLNLIDTPGLSDSAGRDAQHICKVLEILDQYSKHPTLNYISAIFLVIKSTSPFSSNAKEIFKYYERCMPNLFRGAAIINTNFTVVDWKSDYQDAKRENERSVLPITNTRMKKMQTRCDALSNDPEFKEGGSSQHFFIDSKPETPFEEYITREQITDILRFTKYQPSLPIRQMWFCKTSDWLAVDAMLINWLRTARQLFGDNEKELLEKSSNSEKVYANTVKALDACNVDLNTVEQELAMLDVDTEYILTSETTASKSGFQIFTSALAFRGARDSYTITETKVDIFHVTASDNETGMWMRKDQSPTTRTWTGHYQANLGYSPKLPVRSWTTNREFYAKEIRALQEKKTSLIAQRDGLAFNERLLKPEAVTDHRDETLKLGRFVGICDEIIRKLNADKLPLGDASNSIALKRYTRRQESDRIVVTPDDLYRVAYLADKELPYALSAKGKLIFGDSGSAVGERTFWEEIDLLEREEGANSEAETKIGEDDWGAGQRADDWETEHPQARRRKKGTQTHREEKNSHKPDGSTQTGRTRPAQVPQLGPRPVDDVQSGTQGPFHATTIEPYQSPLMQPAQVQQNGSLLQQNSPTQNAHPSQMATVEPPPNPTIQPARAPRSEPHGGRNWQADAFDSPETSEKTQLPRPPHVIRTSEMPDHYDSAHSKSGCCTIL